jgi:hypothetical protein
MRNGKVNNLASKYNYTSVISYLKSKTEEDNRLTEAYVSNFVRCYVEADPKEVLCPLCLNQIVESAILNQIRELIVPIMFQLGNDFTPLILNNLIGPHVERYDSIKLS